MSETLHIVEYEGPFMREDGWQHLRGGVKVREASPSEIIEAARNLEGVKLVNLQKNEWFEDSYQLEGPGRYLVIPLDLAVADARRTEEGSDV